MTFKQYLAREKASAKQTFQSKMTADEIWLSYSGAYKYIYRSDLDW